uniref:RING-type domain-containing protein n=1 Tax=Caenorhabditis tropicalis TaxID=1561998 RepID=A0A1I7TRI7_9PELO
MAPTKKPQNKRNARIAKKKSQLKAAHDNKKVLKDLLKEAEDLENQCAKEGAELQEMKVALDRLYNADAEINECKSCRLEFNKEDRIPRLLKCGHTVCENCYFTKAKTYKREQYPIYKCLECKEKIKLITYQENNDGKPPKNYTIATYIDKYF